MPRNYTFFFFFENIFPVMNGGIRIGVYCIVLLVTMAYKRGKKTSNEIAEHYHWAQWPSEVKKHVCFSVVDFGLCVWCTFWKWLVISFRQGFVTLSLKVYQEDWYCNTCIRCIHNFIESVDLVNLFRLVRVYSLKILQFLLLWNCLCLWWGD